MTAHFARPTRLLAAACLAFVLHGGAAALAETGSPAPAPQPVLNAGPGCAKDVRQAYNDGFLHGVDAIRAQLAQATATMQTQVQAQVNAQLKQLQQQSAAELDTRIAAAQERALEEQANAGAGATIPKDARMPSLTGTLQSLDADTARGTAEPRERTASPASDGGPASLPPGSTLTITDPQNLPPDLYRALMEYAAQ
ncbi:hypothetical protein [uncultured Paracoccus sp.]|uniref:hypothetical protein n=1 Tax=uncultured Paracoccus sp. TaxID=189685 RepID=UPI0026213B83|nr:hypothetical protein [uncultured Paracoccus sp.]